ncbi:hypothetical protein HOLleu_02313 [Holothuria leucospilota]|uniref:Uncharacterized protein n=1 Tax=Holothuria leucospilota TaxID=206669 RepID=A0A9Q1HJP2_HOLLE|nr:hypothetical protein HOLleu_02313 [Holothuria leucospilota]
MLGGKGEASNFKDHVFKHPVTTGESVLSCCRKQCSHGHSEHKLKHTDGYYIWQLCIG